MKPAVKASDPPAGFTAFKLLKHWKTAAWRLDKTITHIYICRQGR